VGPRYPDEKLGFISSDMTPVAVLQTIIVFVSTKRSQYVEPNSAYTSLRVLYRVPHVNCQLCAYVLRYDEADCHVVIRSVAKLWGLGNKCMCVKKYKTCFDVVHGLFVEIMASRGLWREFQIPATRKRKAYRYQLITTTYRYTHVCPLEYITKCMARLGVGVWLPVILGISKNSDVADTQLAYQLACNGMVPYDHDAHYLMEGMKFTMACFNLLFDRQCPYSQRLDG
jgi:hypothetical protein